MKSVLLIPDANGPVLDVAWTLVHEMLFYCFFAIMIVSRRAGILCGIAVLAFIVLANGRFSEPVLKVVADFCNLEFAIGMAAAHVTLKLQVPAALYIAIAGAIGFVAAGMAENAGLFGWDSKSSEMAFALTSGAMIVGLAAGERSGTLRVGAIGRFVGAISYMLYLIHTIAIGIMYRVLSAAGFFAAGAPDWCGVVLATAASLAAATVLYLTYEKPVLSYLQKIRFGEAQAAA
jgi:peptidoglycan/LPS O-acetylase OafA/YrhL